jgi:hypothetical protein
MILVKADKNSEAGLMADEKLLTEMGKYNEELAKAGIMLAGEGPSSNLERRTRQVRWRQAYSDKRAVPRIQGPDRGLLDLAGEVEGRSDRVGQARAVRRRSRNRNSPGARGGGFWRSVYSRTQRAGGTSRRTDGRERKSIGEFILTTLTHA